MNRFYPDFGGMRMVVHVVEIGFRAGISFAMHPKSMRHVFNECPTQPSPYKQQRMKGNGQGISKQPANGHQHSAQRKKIGYTYELPAIGVIVFATNEIIIHTTGFKDEFKV